jgi:hypothetical protein
MAEKEKKWEEQVRQLIDTIDPKKVAKLLSALNETLLKIDFPFTPLELQMACNQLVSFHLLTIEEIFG